MAFGYAPSPANPAAQNIAQLLENQGTIAAQRAKEIAAAQATAGQARGQIWGQTAQAIGQDASQAVQQVGDVVKAKRFSSILSSTPKVKENGLDLYDAKGIMQRLTDAGFGETALKTGAQLMQINDGFRTVQTSKLAAVKLQAEGLASIGSPPDLVDHAIDVNQANGVIDPATADQMHAMIKADPSAAAKITGYFAGPQHPIMGKPGEVPLNPLTAQPMGPGIPSKPIAVAPGSSLVQPDTGQVVTTTPNRPVAVRPGGSLVNPDTGDVVANVPAAPPRAPTPAAGSAADYLARWAKEHGKNIEDLTTEDENAALKAHTNATQKTPVVSGMAALYGQVDPKAVAASIIKGDIPPDTANLGRPASAAVTSELAKQGFNQSSAILDWKATQKHVASLNGPQQLKLNQSINALPELLDSVDALASQWKGGRFPILNKANLALAKGGAYGEDVATVANKLDAQIADVNADLGAVYMGGNSPTDHALALAGKALQGDWDEKVLHSMVGLAKSNVQIRKNSIQNTGVSGASSDNLYQNPPETAAPLRQKAAQVLQQNGHATDDASIDLFLKNNPAFK